MCFNKLAIGSANFGMNYGYINSGRKLEPDLVYKLLDYAWLNNINTIDTAEVYGESELVIGRYLNENQEKKFNIITKINSTELIKEQLSKSLTNLKPPKI